MIDCERAGAHVRTCEHEPACARALHCAALRCAALRRSRCVVGGWVGRWVGWWARACVRPCTNGHACV
eukprot:2299807-Alexandrium_andersonii.AAC.1